MDADCVQSFHLSYVLRTAIQHAARADNSGNVSDFLRGQLEEACKRSLGVVYWDQLQLAADRGLRKDRLQHFLADIDVTLLRRGLEARSNSKSFDDIEFIRRTLEHYVTQFEKARDGEDVEPALAVTLEECVDLIQKFKAMILRPVTAKTGESLQRLAAQLPDSLRADLDAATISRLTAIAPT